MTQIQLKKPKQRALFGLFFAYLLIKL